MDWKKEKISASELEKRQKEYMNEALAMMRKSGSRHTIPVTPERTAELPVNNTGGTLYAAEPKQTDEDAKSGGKAANNTADALYTTEPKQTDEPDEEAKSGGENTANNTADVLSAPQELTEEASDRLSEQNVHDGAAEPGTAGTDDDDKYGVYTAEEVMSGEYSGEGLKKAAEILEEMTRSTIMMKKLAAGDDDPDTTDFPDFSGSESEDGGKARFRRGEKTTDCGQENE